MEAVEVLEALGSSPWRSWRQHSGGTGVFTVEVVEAVEVLEALGSPPWRSWRHSGGTGVFNVEVVEVLEALGSSPLK